MSQEFKSLAKAVSRLLGWSYVLCWSISFYPQPLLNWRRKSVTGLNIDFPTLNNLGFLSYSISTGALFFSDSIKRQYAYRHPVSPETTVRFNDFVFALHGFFLCLITYSQFYSALWGFKVSVTQRASKLALAIIGGSFSSLVIVALLVWITGGEHGADARFWAWIDVISTFGYIKLIATLVKYLPQVYSNYKRKSTHGWSIAQILLDFGGAIMSLLQLVIDSSLQADWSGLTGNPVKLGLAILALVIDMVFMVQHFVLYKSSGQENDGEPNENGQPLLRDVT